MKLRIQRDENPCNPRREFDPLGKMVCWHRNYILGDKHDLEVSDRTSWNDLRELLKERGAAVILPVYLYSHSGLRISTRPFSDIWDSGQVGFIYATEEAIHKSMRPDGMPHAVKEREGVYAEAEAILRAEVKEYDQYLRGDVWGYVITDDRGVERDSCGGIYGGGEARKQGEEALKALEQRAAVLSSPQGAV
jgi:hypothetical protein